MSGTKLRLYCCLIALGLMLCCNTARAAHPVEAPDPAEWTQVLSGTWQFAPEDSTDFQPAPVPGYWGKTPQGQQVGWKEVLNWKQGTYRRTFDVPTDHAGAVLEFDMIRWGGQVLVNGQSAGSHDLGYSPVVLDVSKLTRPGVNQLEVKARGWAALERYQGKHIQIPIGAGHWFGLKEGGIPGQVYLRLYDGARIEPLRIVPTAAGPSCDLSTRVTAGPAPWQGTIAAQVITDDGTTAVSAVRRQAVQLDANQSVTVELKDIQASGASLWSPDAPVLHRMVVWLEQADDRRVACVRDDVFGFREVTIKDGNFYLNGRRLALFGATELVMYSLLNMWDDQDRLHAVQVRLFKAMNAVAFRSHMNPLPRRWLDLCDRNGILVFPEFPNFPDVQIKGDESPYDLPDYWKNLQRDAAGLVASRFNHPSVVGWSASNEGNGFGDWERQRLVPFVKSVDPTRLVMLSADITPEIADQHDFAGLWWGTYAHLDRLIFDLARVYPDRLTGCTEYGAFSGGYRWYGRHEPPHDSDEFRNDVAQILMEHTEAMRRARFDIIMPYGIPYGRASQTGQDADCGPGYHALRNAYSPMAVSLDWSRRHVVAGSTLNVPVWVISDADAAAGPMQVDVLLLDRRPGFDWDGATDGVKVLARTSFEIDLSAWAHRQQKVTLTAPATPGGACLAAVLRKKGDQKTVAISLRPLRVYPPLPALKRPRVVGVVETDGRLADWLGRRGHRVVLPYLDKRPDVILIAEGRLYDERARTHGFSMANRIANGCRMVVLEQQAWQADRMQENMRQALDGVTARPIQVALENVFTEPGFESILGPAADYARLNGLENEALRVGLHPDAEAVETEQTGPGAKLTPDADQAASATAAQPSVWTPMIVGFGTSAEQPDWALARRDYGKGHVLACQIPLTGRLDPGTADQFDPVAERLLALLIESDELTAVEPLTTQPAEHQPESQPSH
ncbi:MAG TPA: glycoside hydrolase family 2 TIM barrel-domain containing protein [Phycisphaerae bacterium]|nr:glycoside hydrolase family 2 TIM barrel-domain containing protein [Phycisphaerae bacterium]